MLPTKNDSGKGANVLKTHLEKYGEILTKQMKSVCKNMWTCMSIISRKNSP